MKKVNTPMTDNQQKVKKTVLIVDDSEMMRFLMISILEKDFNLITKNDGQEALDYLQQGNRPDLILLDMLMPNMNGRTFARRVTSDPRYAQIPIIFTTTVDSLMLINSFKALGVLDYIVKPFLNDDLLVRVKEILKS
jgi:CheY-like chemotaxis protein